MSRESNPIWANKKLSHPHARYTNLQRILIISNSLSPNLRRRTSYTKNSSLYHPLYAPTWKWFFIAHDNLKILCLSDSESRGKWTRLALNKIFKNPFNSLALDKSEKSLTKIPHKAANWWNLRKLCKNSCKKCNFLVIENLLSPGTMTNCVAKLLHVLVKNFRIQFAGISRNIQWKWKSCERENYGVLSLCHFVLFRGSRSRHE